MGDVARVTHRVADADTAVALGSGDVPVLATPRLVAWLEAATVAAVASSMRADRTSVGTRVDVEHRRATPVGAEVTVRARVTSVDGRTLGFDVVAEHRVRGARGPGPDGSAVAGDEVVEQVAVGTVTRVVVDRDRFVRGLPAPVAP